MFEELFVGMGLMTRRQRKALSGQGIAAQAKPRPADVSRRDARKAQRRARAITRKARKGGK